MEIALDCKTTRIFTAFLFLFAMLFGALNPAHAAYYDMGAPALTDIWVDPVNGSDGNSGSSRAQALRTFAAAWAQIPAGSTLTTTGYRILLAPGDYAESGFPSSNYLEARRGTYNFPIVIQASDGPDTVRIHAYLNIYNVSYFYLIDLSFVTDPGYGSGSNVIHIAGSSNILIKRCRINGFDGTTRQPQESLKVNQVQYIYVEDSDISGAFWFPLDYVAVQYGHVVNSRIHNSGDDCFLFKGGTAYIRAEGNEIYDCGVTGISAGQGTGFEYMVSPWLHYEVYDIKYVNNLIHDVVNAGVAVRGGYNILVAHNTFYRTGYDSRGSGLVLVSQGARSCDGDSAACTTRHNAGGWGPAQAGDGGEWIPNRNIYIYNNIFYNPAAVQTQSGHFVIFGPATPPAGTNIQSPAYADKNLYFRGNIIWDGPSDHPLGIEDSSQGCQNSNPTCNSAQLQADNTINKFEPQMNDAANGNFHPTTGSNILSAASYATPDFTGNDRPSPPLPPAGDLSNTVSTDLDGNSRTTPSAPGAYAISSTCAAILSPDLKLYVPVLTFNGQSYWADFLYASGFNFMLSKAGSITDAGSYAGCAPAALSSNLRLHIPSVTYNAISYWADFQYATGMIFTLTGAGAN